MTRRIPRPLARALIWLFRHRLGWLLGGRIMMLEHTARRTGQPRHVALEVLQHQPGTLVVVSGYGRRSQWLANIRTQPAVRIWAGTVRARPGTATILPPDVSRHRLETYRQHRRRAAAILGRILDIPLVEAQLRRVDTHLPGHELHRLDWQLATPRGNRPTHV